MPTPYVFYSWQSDSPAKSNRYFIRSCLSEALKSISNESELEEAIRLESDTTGLPGTPDIASSIFERIASASVFVADVTLCCGSAGSRMSPNPNVLIEVGYAFRAIGDAKVLLVMNEEHGGTKQLPFDLAHKRWPIRYNLGDSSPPGATSTGNQKVQLTNNFRQAIRLILERTKPTEHTVKPLQSTAGIEERIRESEPRQDWEMIASGARSIATYKHDVNLRLEIHYDADGIQNDKYTDSWANQHRDSRAIGYWCDIYYGASPVRRTILVSVDGGRALLPIPRQRDSEGKICEVLPLDYAIARIFDHMGTLDGYLQRSGLSLSSPT